jgi:hypothetical protein
MTMQNAFKKSQIRLFVASAAIAAVIALQTIKRLSHIKLLRSNIIDYFYQLRDNALVI